MGSTRLPGKVLLPFGDSTVLGHILDRLAPLGLPLWVATTDSAVDDSLVAAVGDRACVARGPEYDVLERTLRICLDEMPTIPRAIVRVCADRPLLCADLVGRVIERWRLLEEPDYVANNLPPSFPYGLDVEIVTVAALERARDSADPYEREHVTPFVYRRPGEFRLHNVLCPYGNFSTVRVALDTEADYAALGAVHMRLSQSRVDYGWREVLTLAAIDPEIFP